MAVEEWVSEGSLELAEPIEKKPFDARTEVSADAKYIVKQIVLWFFVAPIVFGILGGIIYTLVNQ